MSPSNTESQAGRIMPDDYAATGDAFARLGFSTAPPDKLICSDCHWKEGCNKSPFRKWCNSCQGFSCGAYTNPKTENGNCNKYLRASTYSIPPTDDITF